jgi:hypothetical protein
VLTQGAFDFCRAACNHQRVKSNKHNRISNAMLIQERAKKLRKTYTQKIWCAENRLNAGFFAYVIIEWE